MSATFHWFGNALLNVLKGNIDFDTDTFKLSLHTSAYTPDQDANDFFNDVTNEVSGTGYTAGGATLTSPTQSYDAATNQARLAWADVTWPTSTIANARTLIIRKSRGGASSADELIAYATNDADVSSTAATFTADLPAVVLYITAS